MKAILKTPQKRTAQMKKVIIKQYPELENLEVMPSAEEQVFKSEKYGFDEVKVKGVESEELTIVPSANEQVFEGMFNEVRVEGDENLKPENILKNKEIFGVKGNVEADPELIASFISSIDGSKGSNCTKLPDGITEISNYAFYQCTNLALTELPNSVTEIGNYAFRSCKNIGLVRLSDNLISIGDYAFEQCNNIKLTELPNTLISIGNNAFYDCYRLALTELPDSLISIGNNAFDYCYDLALTELPAGITKLGTRVFSNCRNITSIDVKGNVTSIGADAFYSCSNLSKIIFSNVTGVPTLIGSNVFGNTPIKSGKGYIYFPDDLVESVKSATNWSIYADQIKGVSEL